MDNKIKQTRMQTRKKNQGKITKSKVDVGG